MLSHRPTRPALEKPFTGPLTPGAGLYFNGGIRATVKTRLLAADRLSDIMFSLPSYHFPNLCDH